MPARLLAPVAVAAVLAVPGAPGPAQAGPAPAAPVPAAATRATPAAVEVPARPSGGALVGPAVTVAAGAFPAGQRFVSAAVSARHSAGSSRRATMLSVELTCGGQSVQATTNVVTSAVLTPRRVMRDARACTVVARSAVNDATPADGLRVTATLTSAPASWGAVGYSPAGHPRLLRPGARRQVVPVTATVPPGIRTVRVTGDVKVTTCTSVGGSRENGSPPRCAAHRVDAAGTRVRVSLVVRQGSTTGGHCAVRTVASHTVHVAKRVHHAMVSPAGTFTLSAAPGCGRVVRAQVHVRVLGGADLVIHRKGTITSLYR
ncbi:hypothetical protein [Jidongwangia harbinensis]|uniref:hypothetical protein n=1 Tax=Jidongwangia harbinensis TaxID=2878561 RepID=UPI001CD9AAD1|nr:hypothetical protein [Jidongwangia harbinensis]MCA2218779.1 hypothetical protein [Jidongwangia harbinensis]